MELSDEMLEEFQTIYEREFGEKLNKTEASEMAFRVLTLYELLAKRLPKNTQVKPPDALAI